VLTITQINYIRKLFFDKGKSYSEIEKATGHSYTTIKKYIECDDFNEQNSYNRQKPIKSDLIRPFIKQILEDDKIKRRKFRHTSERIYERAMDECPKLCLIKPRTMRKIVKEEREKVYGSKQCYNDLEHPGGEAQVDFGEIEIFENGSSVTAHELVLSFPKSNAGFCQVTRSETKEALCEGLQKIFEHIGVVPKVIWFDQMAAACIRQKDQDGKGVATENFLRFATHYSFEPVFCNPYSGNEKGNVEKKVGYFRQHLFVPEPNIIDLQIYNKQLLPRCDKDNDRVHYLEETKTHNNLFKEELPLMHEVTKVLYDTSKMVKRRVDKYGYAKTDSCWYSVSPRHVGQYIWMKSNANTIHILDDDYREITMHQRSFIKHKRFTHWVDFLGVIAKRPRALKYSKFYSLLPDRWQDYTESLFAEDLKKAIQFLRFCLIEADLEFANKVLAENLTKEVREPEALWTTYYRFKENSELYQNTILMDHVPSVPIYDVTLTDYDELMGGLRQ